jgi:hypothetical protein
MPTVQYFRSQAEACLRMAQHASAPGVVVGLRSLAARYLDEAGRAGPKPVIQQQQQIQAPKNAE